MTNMIQPMHIKKIKRMSAGLCFVFFTLQAFHKQTLILISDGLKGMS